MARARKAYRLLRKDGRIQKYYANKSRLSRERYYDRHLRAWVKKDSLFFLVKNTWYLRMDYRSKDKDHDLFIEASYSKIQKNSDRKMSRDEAIKEIEKIVNDIGLPLLDIWKPPSGESKINLRKIQVKLVAGFESEPSSDSLGKEYASVAWSHDEEKWNQKDR